MPTLSIPFPEGDKVVLLRGAQVSVGRFADNTIQIQDRTVSGYHFQLHLEGDHYRLHDSGSANGVVVNGRRVHDYHLREACEIQVGSVRCEFHPGHPMKMRREAIELLPVHEEVEAVRDENHRLKVENAVLAEQVRDMMAARKESVAGKLDDCLETIARQNLALEGLREDNAELALKLTILGRERDNLERLYGATMAELASLRAGTFSASGRVLDQPLPEHPAVAPEEGRGAGTIPLQRNPDPLPPLATGTQKLKP